LITSTLALPTFFYLFYLEHFSEQNEMTDAQTERKERKRGLTGHDSERNIKRKKCWKEKRDALQTKKIVFLLSICLLVPENLTFGWDQDIASCIFF
jgi:hypothetical protein